jgi:hypothetical protein
MFGTLQLPTPGREAGPNTSFRLQRRPPALVHEFDSGRNFSACLTNWLLHGERLRPAKLEHSIQEVARDQRFSFLRFGMMQVDIKTPTTSREGGVIRRFEIEIHQREQ